MNARRFFYTKQKLQRGMPTVLLLAGSSFVSSAFAASPPSFSGNFSAMYTTSTTDSMGNTTYSLDFHMTGAGLPVQFTNLSSGLSGAVTEDLSVSYGSSGTSNGSGGPVTLSKLVITEGTNQATYDITGAIQTQYGNPSNSATWVGAITGGIATLDTNPAQTTPAFASYLSTIPTSHFTLSYVGAYSSSSGVAPMLAPSGSASYNAVVAVPEPESIATAGIGATILGGFAWRRRRAKTVTKTGRYGLPPVPI
jgi:hypothetical protein